MVISSLQIIMCLGGIYYLPRITQGTKEGAYACLPSACALLSTCRPGAWLGQGVIPEWGESDQNEEGGLGYGIHSLLCGFPRARSEALIILGL